MESNVQSDTSTKRVTLLEATGEMVSIRRSGRIKNIKTKYRKQNIPFMQSRNRQRKKFSLLL